MSRARSPTVITQSDRWSRNSVLTVLRGADQSTDSGRGDLDVTGMLGDA